MFMKFWIDCVVLKRCIIVTARMEPRSITISACIIQTDTVIINAPWSQHDTLILIRTLKQHCNTLCVIEKIPFTGTDIKYFTLGSISKWFQGLLVLLIHSTVTRQISPWSQSILGLQVKSRFIDALDYYV